MRNLSPLTYFETSDTKKAINCSIIETKSKNLIAGVIDLKDRGFGIEGTGNDGEGYSCIVLSKGKEVFEIVFDYKNWDVFCCDMHKSILRVCLIKK